MVDEDIKEAIYTIDESYARTLNEVDETILHSAMILIKGYCKNHPTCDGCSYRKEYIGCEFRGKSPREW